MPDKMTSDSYFMQRCFELALKGIGMTSPNPLVGSVIVKNGKIIGEGFHSKAGSDHAELAAIKNAIELGHDLSGSTLYCNLEPCCHTNKRTPPCAQRIVQEGISRVVLSTLDPNPQVAGQGVKLLKENGIEVQLSILEEQGLELNEVFFTTITQKRPYIILKWAQSLDGQLATATGDSKWISNALSRVKAHQLRLEVDAILIGAETLRSDNPSLTVRDYPNPNGKCPIRIVVSSKPISGSYNLFSDDHKDKTIVFVPASSERSAGSYFEHLGIKHLAIETGGQTHINAAQIINSLHKLSISSVLIEGGSSILTRFLQENLYDRVELFIAPKILGPGLPAVGQLAINMVDQAKTFHRHQWEINDGDLHFTGRRQGLRELLCLPESLKK